MSTEEREPEDIEAQIHSQTATQSGTEFGSCYSVNVAEFDDVERADAFHEYRHQALGLDKAACTAKGPAVAASLNATYSENSELTMLTEATVSSLHLIIAY